MGSLSLVGCSLDGRGAMIIALPWSSPPTGGFARDGAVKGSGKASAGGLVRDSQGMWLGGFMANIGRTSVLQTGRTCWGKGGIAILPRHNSFNPPEPIGPVLSDLRLT
ncbi:polynucleotidyl transferase [Striga asiatica]|uniref:Polynucleotidyl transferase n=1 Tax=Striga asiatica TaxID=4170 RepID=A0A5A7QMI7_STRAF|nr:polynucleotidyl transferase [Striga asiatica]